MPTAPRPPLDPMIEDTAMLALYRQGLPWRIVWLNYRAWLGGARVEDISCVEEEKGKAYGLETACRCAGCVTRRCLTFFDMVRTQFDPR